MMETIMAIALAAMVVGLIVWATWLTTRKIPKEAKKLRSNMNEWARQLIKDLEPDK